MNPRLSRAATVVLPSFSPSAKPSFTDSSPVPSARTTSSSGMTWAGLKKWSPRKRSGREVAAACSATGSDEVLVAKVAPVLDHHVDLSPHLELHVQILGDRLDHEVAVREIRVLERRRDSPAYRVRVGLLRASPSRPRGRAACRSCRCRASSFSWLTSRTTTSQPACAQIWAIPWPIRPQPTTPTLLISIRRPPSLDRFWARTEPQPIGGARGP